MKLALRRLPGLLGRALLLEPDPYTELKEAPNPFVEGAFLVVVVGLAVAVAGLVGSILTWASSPDLAAIKQIVYENLVKMPWYLQMEEELGSRFVQDFNRWYDQGWRIFPVLFGAPNPLLSLANIVLTPLNLILSWLVYGVIAHLVARFLKGRATLAQTLGCTALAVAPQLLNLITVLPFVTVGAVVGTWTLLCRYRGLKEAHTLPWGRAFIATVLPTLIIYLLVALLSIAAAITLGPAIAGRWQP